MKKTENFVGIRFQTEDLIYLKKSAKEKGVSLSEFLRKSVFEGMMAEKAEEISLRMTELSEEHFAEKALLGERGRDELFLALFEVQKILSDALNKSDPERLKAIKIESINRLNKIKGHESD